MLLLKFSLVLSASRTSTETNLLPLASLLAPLHQMPLPGGVPSAPQKSGCWKTMANGELAGSGEWVGKFILWWMGVELIVYRMGRDASSGGGAQGREGKSLMSTGCKQFIPQCDAGSSFSSKNMDSKHEDCQKDPLESSTGLPQMPRHQHSVSSGVSVEEANVPH